MRVSSLHAVVGLLTFSVAAACSSSSTVDGGTGGQAGASASAGTNSGASGSAGTSAGGSAGELGGAGTGGSGGSGGTMAVDTICPAAGCPISCEGLANTCGPSGDQNCCASSVVPGGTYRMGRSTAGSDSVAVFVDSVDSETDSEVPEHEAFVSEFRLDRYEVTVGRFRAFLEAWPNSRPRLGDGARPGLPATGWIADWDTFIEPATATMPDAVSAMLSCSFRSTWADRSSPEADARPQNCVPFHYAFAFCAWDGGWLPSEAEWEFAAAGGDENRLYPWGAEAPTTDLAGFDCNDGDYPCDIKHIRVPGSYAAGIGRYGHYDLAGNMIEWVIDVFDPGYYTSVGKCNNCINATSPTPEAPLAVLRGGGWLDHEQDVRAAARQTAPRETEGRDEDTGIRCARPVQ